jgi:hypothetical protein
MTAKLSIKRIIAALLFAPLSTFVVTFGYFLILGLTSNSMKEAVGFDLFVAFLATTLFSYPGNRVVGLGLIVFYRQDASKLSPAKFIVTALALTVIIANVELLEDGFGIAYLLSAAASSACFWLIAIYPSRHSPERSG